MFQASKTGGVRPLNHGINLPSTHRSPKSHWLLVGENRGV